MAKTSISAGRSGKNEGMAEAIGGAGIEIKAAS
jgi:hypothetical protein